MIKKVKELVRWFWYRGLYKPGHFYSPIPDLQYVSANSERIFRKEAPLGIDLKENEQLKLLGQMRALKTDFAWPDNKSADFRYYSKNTFFNRSDAFALFCMLRLKKSRALIEIGSGYSSAVIVDTNEKYLFNKLSVTFIEPYPDRLNSLLKESDLRSNVYKLIPKFIQDVDKNIFASLSENDILFIDSSHVSKVGSDLNYILFDILPRLNSGVYIHFHDIFYPLEYPKEWIEQGIYWNEIYLIRSFLMFNADFEIVLFNNHWNSLNLQDLEEFQDGGSLWLKKIR